MQDIPLASTRLYPRWAVYLYENMVQIDRSIIYCCCCCCAVDRHTCRSKTGRNKKKPTSLFLVLWSSRRRALRVGLFKQRRERAVHTLCACMMHIRQTLQSAQLRQNGRPFWTCSALAVKPRNNVTIDVPGQVAYYYSRHSLGVLFAYRYV